jgi:hypothetical protein
MKNLSEMMAIRGTAVIRVSRWPEDYVTERAFTVSLLRRLRSSPMARVSPGYRLAIRAQQSYLAGLREAKYA